MTQTPGFAPLVTVAIPSLNQGKFLSDALTSVFQEGLPVEVFIADGGSTDETLQIIRRWESRLAGWRSHADAGQSAARATKKLYPLFAGITAAFLSRDGWPGESQCGFAPRCSRDRNERFDRRFRSRHKRVLPDF